MAAGKQIVLITGASSGIGLAAARLFSEKGYIVYGASRRGSLPGLAGESLRPLIMDVTDRESVNAGVETILATHGKIDILIHAAGDGLASPAELLTAEHAQRQFDVNFYGAIRLVNAVLPAMRARKCGRILFVGSVGGIFAVPFQSLYSSSKSALSIYTSALRLELKPFHIYASIVEPGDVKTGFTAARQSAGCNDAYAAAMERAVSRMERDEQNGMEPARVARAILKLAQKKKPPKGRVVGASYRVFVFLKRILPDALAEKLLYKVYLK